MSITKTELNETKKIIAEMLKENTGRALCDSGGAYGRNWERNQTRKFEKEKPITLSIENGYINLTKNVYHYLVDHLTYHKEFTQKFQEFCELPENEDKYYLELMESFFPYLQKKGEITEYELQYTNNTYNGECSLSQTLQYSSFFVDTEAIIILQVHGGCDVRGGYTIPKVFYHNDDSFELYNDATIGCKNGHYWQTDNNYHYYQEGSTRGTNLESYEREELEEDLAEEDKPLYTKAVLNKKIFGKEVLIRDYKYKGKIMIYEDKAYCPICGELLTAY